MRVFIPLLILIASKGFSQKNIRLLPPFYHVGVQLEYNHFGANQFLLGGNVIGPLKKHPKLIISYDASISRIFHDSNNEIGSKIGSGLTYNSKWIISPNIKIAVEYNTKKDLRIGGESGITFMRLINLNYGFYPLVNGIGENYICPHRLTATIKINYILRDILAGHMMP